MVKIGLLEQDALLAAKECRRDRTKFYLVE